MDVNADFPAMVTCPFVSLLSVVVTEWGLPQRVRLKDTSSLLLSDVGMDPDVLSAFQPEENLRRSVHGAEGGSFSRKLWVRLNNFTEHNYFAKTALVSVSFHFRDLQGMDGGPLLGTVETEPA